MLSEIQCQLQTQGFPRLELQLILQKGKLTLVSVANLETLSLDLATVQTPSATLIVKSD